MTTEQLQQIRARQAEGYSARDIADELGLTRQQVESELTSGGTDQPELDEADLDDLGLEADEFTALNGIFSRLKKQKEQLATEREQLAQQKAELAQKLGQLPGHEEQFETFKKRMHREKMTARFNFLVNELLDNSNRDTWSGMEVDDFLERASSLQERVQKFCDANRIDERRLLIYKGLDHIIDLVEGMQQRQTSGLFSGKSVHFHFKPETRATIEGFVTANFEDETQTAPVAGAGSSEGDDEDWNED